MSISLAIKRAVDVVLSLGVAMLASPLLLLIALAIRLTSRGPILLKQERIGKEMRTFEMYKFRTMRADHKATLAWTAADAEAVTSIGGFLRDYGFDELPQLLNILKGDMSIIGPRPPLATQADRYRGPLEAMFRMKPGVLSLAAAYGRRGIPPEKRAELHVEYVQRWSLLLDWHIFWRCFFVVLRKENANDTAVHP